MYVCMCRYCGFFSFNVDHSREDEGIVPCHVGAVAESFLFSLYAIVLCHFINFHARYICTYVRILHML